MHQYFNGIGVKSNQTILNPWILIGQATDLQTLDLKQATRKTC
jgi:hypothetical protein